MRPDLYLSRGEHGDGPLLTQISAYFHTMAVDRNKYGNPTTKGDHSLLPKAVKAAIAGAMFLIDTFHLQVTRSEHLFTPMPWFNPGDELMVTSKMLLDMDDSMMVFADCT